MKGPDNDKTTYQTKMNNMSEKKFITDHHGDVDAAVSNDTFVQEALSTLSGEVMSDYESDTTVAIMASKIEKVSRGSTAEREESQGPSVESEVVVLIEVDMKKLSKMPFDVKLYILQELLFLWRFEESDMYVRSNRLLLWYNGSQSTSGRSSRDLPSGWTVIPIMENILPEYLALPWTKGNKVLIQEVLQVTTMSKKFDPYLKTFFFSHMVFHFLEKADFLAVADYRSISNFPQTYLAMIKSIAVSSEEHHYRSYRLHGWGGFRDLFEVMCVALLSETMPSLGLNFAESPFPNLEYLRIEFCPANSIRNALPFSIDPDTSRICYLATRCWQLANRYPKLCISIQGYAWADWVYSFSKESYAHDRSKEWINVNRDRGYGFAFSEEEIEEFGNGTSDLLSGLPQIEFANVLNVTFDGTGVANMQWQMEFARQWKLICSSYEGGYPTVIHRWS